VNNLGFSPRPGDDLERVRSGLMGANEQNSLLMQALEAEEALKLRGFTASCGPTGAVVVDRWGHVRGVWHFHNGNYFWTPAGNNQPTLRVQSHDEALAYTLNVVSKL